MDKKLIVLFTLYWVTNFVYSKNESNIQKVNSRKVSEIEVNVSNFSQNTNTNEEVIVTDENFNRSYSATNEYEKGDKNLLIKFSKNNPELDWKKPLKMVTNSSGKQEDIDIDFMTEKLEKTANSIQWLVDLYDPLRWRKIPGNLQESCRTDMEWFLDGLKEGKVWAAKSRYYFVLHLTE